MTGRNTGTGEDLIDLHRRHFLRGVAASPFAGATLSKEVRAESHRQIRVQQEGGIDETIVPFGAQYDMDVVEFYNYDGRHRPGSSDGNGSVRPSEISKMAPTKTMSRPNSNPS